MRPVARVNSIVASTICMFSVYSLYLKDPSPVGRRICCLPVSLCIRVLLKSHVRVSRFSLFN
ncbi:hypothetical protein LX36DRAFT_729431 [Colletotrichum falcatum]|nr:hypothetical protein LX36DRAFT_729431 [Colletotrichum falcatum]